MRFNFILAVALVLTPAALTARPATSGLGAAQITDASDVALLEQDEEKAVASALVEVERTVRPALKKEDFSQAMQPFARLRAPIDAFVTNPYVIVFVCARSNGSKRAHQSIFRALSSAG